MQSSLLCTSFGKQLPLLSSSQLMTITSSFSVNETTESDGDEGPQSLGNTSTTIDVNTGGKSESQSNYAILDSMFSQL